MEKDYKQGDIIEYLGVRYYVIGDTDDDWPCISGHTFRACYLPKSKITKFIGSAVVRLKRFENEDQVVHARRENATNW